MAEVENSNFIKGHNLSLKQIRLDIYRLLCYFEASKSIAEQASKNNELNSKGLASEFMEDEISRILLECAIILRIMDDESEADIDEKDSFYCGELLSNNKVKNLSLREACNKIIHGTKINYDIEKINKYEYLVPKVYIYGYRGQEEWKATIDIRKFVDYGTRLLITRTLNEYMELKSTYS